MTVRMTGTRLAACGAVLVGIGAFGPAAPAQARDSGDSGNFYKGKTVNIIVGYGPGGGYDAYARLLGRHIGSHIPGHPTVVVQNMPGAGSLKAIQYLKTTAPKDGTVIDAFNFGQITLSLVMPTKTLNFDFRDFNWVGSINRDVSVCYVWKPSINVNTVAELARRGPVHFGLTARGSASYFNQSMLSGVLGVQIKQIAGYTSSKAKQLAIERGELDGDCGAWSSVPQDWLKHDKINVLVMFSKVRPEDMPKSIPYAGDLVSSQRKKDIIHLLTAATEMGRPYIMAKEVPMARVRTIRAAFNATMADPKFLAEAKKEQRPVSPMTGEEAEKALNQVYSLPHDIVEEAKQVLMK